MSQPARPMPSVFRMMRRGVMFWFSFPLVLMGVFFVAAALFMASVERAFEAGSEIMPGTVIEKDMRLERDSDGASSWRYYITYRFTDPGGTVRQDRRSVASGLYAAAERGAPIDIQVESADWSSHRIAGESTWIGVYIFGPVGAILFVVGIVLFVLARHGALRLRRLLTQGVVVTGRVAEICGTSTTVNDVPQFRMAYTYRAPDGTEHWGESAMAPRSRFAGLAPGDPVALRLDPRDPAESAWEGEVPR